MSVPPLNTFSLPVLTPAGAIAVTDDVAIAVIYTVFADIEDWDDGKAISTFDKIYVLSKPPAVTEYDMVDFNRLVFP